MRVFVVGTARSGTTTLYQACRHIKNYTAGHESEAGMVPTYHYPNQNIEASHLLVIAIPLLRSRYPDSKWVHIVRNKEKTVASMRRQLWDWSEWWVAQWYLTQQHSDIYYGIESYYDRVNDLCKELMPAEHMTIDIDTAKEQWPDFWNWIGAEGEMEAAMKEFDRAYNPAIKRGQDEFIDVGTKVDISAALKIPGWMSETELRWLAEQALTHKSIVELGTFLGRTTRALGDHTSGKVFAIDCWPPFIPAAQTEGEEVPPMDGIEQLRRFLGYMGGILFTTVVPIICKHGQAECLNLKPDMVFIDGGHKYQEVKRDIEIWRKQLQPGGLLCGHDVQPDFPGVEQAVKEIFGVCNVVPGTFIWVAP